MNLRRKSFKYLKTFKIYFILRIGLVILAISKAIIRINYIKSNKCYRKNDAFSVSSRKYKNPRILKEGAEHKSFIGTVSVKMRALNQ